MGFRRKLIYFLVHQLKLSHTAARQLVDDGAVCIDGTVVEGNPLIGEWEEIRVKDVVHRSRREPVYLKFNKPAGYESSLHPSVPDNLSAFFSAHRDLAIAGRLDKASEGLLLLSNDGPWVERVCHPRFEKEKEYHVKLEREPEPEFLHRFSTGVWLGDYLTQPCTAEHLSDTTIRVVLREGKNRQIRRMCHRLGHTVLRLKRVRMGNIQLHDLASGTWTSLAGNEQSEL